MAKRFLEEGAQVTLVGRSAGKLAATDDRLNSLGPAATAVADAGDEATTAAAVAATIDRFGGLDVLVANAGMEGQIMPVESQTAENFEAVLRTNVVGVWLAMKHSVDAMKRRGGGSMIAMSSIGGLIGFPGSTPYIASKHAVYGLVKTVALELGESHIRVNAIGPGPIDNRMMASLGEQVAPDDPAGMRAGIEGMIPMKHYGTNEEVANLALFLASNESTYCSGGMYVLDGGYTAA